MNRAFKPRGEVCSLVRSDFDQAIRVRENLNRLDCHLPNSWLSAPIPLPPLAKS
jgi:hypothetical protein